MDGKRQVARLIFILSSIILLFVSCSDALLRKQMKTFMGKHIEFPSEVVIITDGRVRSSKIGSENPKLVLFHGREECSLCAISHLYDDLSGFEDIARRGKCDVVILFSPTIDDMLDVQEQVRDLKFPFPIYVDLYGDFYRLNADFPSDNRFHSFLLGKDGYPIFIGNPLDGEYMMEVFERALDTIK